MSTAAALILLAAAYLFGAIPWGVILGRVVQKTDLREHGSKSTGTTNAYRVLGWRLSLAVLALDIGKGALPVIIARQMDASWWVIGAAGVLATAGHCWSPYIGFKGGKGVATAGGAAIAIFPWIALLFFFVLAVVIATRYVSLASISVAVVASLLCVGVAWSGHLPWASTCAIIAMAAIILRRHHENIGRLRTGTERKLAWPPGSAGQGKSAA